MGGAREPTRIPDRGRQDMARKMQERQEHTVAKSTNARRSARRRAGRITGAFLAVVLLTVSGAPAMAGSIATGAPTDQKRDCWGILGVIRTTEMLDEALSRNTDYRQIRKYINYLDRQHRKLTRHLATDHGKLWKDRSYHPDNWLSRSFRERARRSYKRASKGLNCSQMLGKKLGIGTPTRGNGERFMRDRSYLKMLVDSRGELAFLFFAMSFLALLALAARDYLERRRDVRYIVHIRTIGEFRNSIVGIEIRDISSGGARIETQHPLPVKRGEEISIRIVDRFVPGEVVWTAENLIGIRFRHRMRIPKEITLHAQTVS